MASFIRHVNTMESPDNPSYLLSGPQPVKDIGELPREASFENLAELQCYLEQLQFEATTLRLCSNGIQDQIMDESQRVDLYVMRMITEPNRTRRSQGWLPHWVARANQPQPPAAPVQATAQEQASGPPPMAAAAAAKTLPFKAAPSTRPPMFSNPMIASAPRNALDWLQLDILDLAPMDDVHG